MLGYVARVVLTRKNMDGGDEFVPPSYLEATGQHASLGGGVTFVDFIPRCTEGASIFSFPKFEPFRSVVDRANQWLHSQLPWEAKTCESVEFKTSVGQMIYHEKMIYRERGDNRTWYIRGLRLWIIPRVDPSRPPQQIGYLNLVPEVTGTSGFWGFPTFETLNSLLARFNSSLRSNPLPGRVLTVESKEMKIPNFSSFDPDRSFWSEHGDRQRHFLFNIRIFYEKGPPTSEEIGVADFVPAILSEGGIFTLPTFEQFSSVISKASQWCAQQEGIRFCNVQSVEIKMKRGGSQAFDTQRTSYTEHAGKTTSYLRILRVTYAKAYFDSGILSTPSLQLTCKTFLPVQLTSGILMPKFEGLTQTRSRMEAWLKATGKMLNSWKGFREELLEWYLGWKDCHMRRGLSHSTCFILKKEELEGI
ncbi:uncharacterized protein LOC143226172 isoform X2 [Tachypleus tridentatus]|uniref:uncharacterized protein LOC143226172 isoform X2 n=1 Tax=Tachypleus tridentatus TaxID=6853 RepID=UPI003FD4629F